MVAIVLTMVEFETLACSYLCLECRTGLRFVCYVEHCVRVAARVCAPAVNVGKCFMIGCHLEQKRQRSVLMYSSTSQHTINTFKELHYI